MSHILARRKASTSKCGHRSWIRRAGVPTIPIRAAARSQATARLRCHQCEDSEVPVRISPETKRLVAGLHARLEYGPVPRNLSSDRHYDVELGRVAEAFLTHRDAKQLRSDLESVPAPKEVSPENATWRIDTILRDACLVLGDYQSVWDRLRPEGVVANQVLWLFPHVDDVYVDARDMRTPRFEMTTFGQANLAGDFFPTLNAMLREKQDSEGRNFVESFYQQWAIDFGALPYQEAVALLHSVGFEGEQRGTLRQWYLAARNPGRIEWVRVGRYRFRLPDRFRCLPGHAHVLYERWVREVSRDAENALREVAGTHRIGAGWVTETLLAEQLRERLPEFELVRHARPGWLAPQHLDVYFPHLNVGVEYQGEQHHQPIARFGGEDGFRVTQQRDARKRTLCAENGCKLIEVLPGYDLDQVIRQVRAAASSTSDLPGV